MLRFLWMSTHAWTHLLALSSVKRWKQYRPFFIEDPLRSENSASLKLVRQQTSVPLAVGEQFDSKWRFREAIEGDLMDYCRVDLCIAGGLTEARKITGWCETHYIHIVPHNPFGPVATAACLQLCLASALVGVQELSFPPMTRLTDVFPVQVPFADGYLLPPEGPGLGIEFNEEALINATPPTSHLPPVLEGMTEHLLSDRFLRCSDLIFNKN